MSPSSGRARVPGSPGASVNRGAGSSNGGRRGGGGASKKRPPPTSEVTVPPSPPPALRDMKNWPQLRAPEAQLNSKPLLFSAAASSLPLTEDLRGEEDLAGFVLPSGGHGHRPQPQQPQQQQPHHRRQMPPQPLFTVVTSPPANGAPGTAVASPKKQRGGGGQCGRRGCDGGGGGGGCHLFVGNVPHSAHREQIADSFARFGRVTEVILFQKDGGGNGGGAPPYFCFVVFSDPSSADAALAAKDEIFLAPPRIGIRGHQQRPPQQQPRLHVERRRDNRPNAVDRLAARYGVVSRRKSLQQEQESTRCQQQQQQVSPPQPPPTQQQQQRCSTTAATRQREARILRESVHFRSLCRRFNWRLAAAKYIFRKQTMEDYLAVYIHALAAYRSSTTDSAWDSEPVETLAQRLIVLSESCPEDLAEIMAPSISGVVYNQAAAASGGNGGGGGGAGPPCKKTFDVRAILDRRRDLFILDQHGGRVTYCFQDSNQDSLFAGDGGSAPLLYSSVVVEKREAAKRRLRFILVEGLFVYFFAKFCHGPRFKIKVPFYQRSEPVRSVLQLVTGRTDVSQALSAFFSAFSDIFVSSPSSSDLSLTVDYFSKTHRETMRRYLDDERELYGEDEDYEDPGKFEEEEAVGDKENHFMESPPSPPPVMQAPLLMADENNNNNGVYNNCNNSSDWNCGSSFDTCFSEEERTGGNGIAMGGGGGGAASYFGSGSVGDEEEEEDIRAPSSVAVFSEEGGVGGKEHYILSGGGGDGPHRLSAASALIDGLLAPSGLAQSKSLSSGSVSPCYYTPPTPSPLSSAAAAREFDSVWPPLPLRPTPVPPAVTPVNHLPASVQSVVEQVLLDEDDEDDLRLLTNPRAVDMVADRMERGFAANAPPLDWGRRAWLKTRLEQEARRILAELLG